jgi:PKD repeat protein
MLCLLVGVLQSKIMSTNRVNDPFEDLKENGHLKKAAKREIPCIISRPYSRNRFDQRGAYASKLVVTFLLILPFVSLLTQAEPVSTSDFSATPTSGCSPLAVIFTDLSSNPNKNFPITKWEWDFNGDGVIERTDIVAPTPFTYTYTTPGTYTVTLKATNSGGTNTKTTTNYITAYGPPTANFTATPNSGCSPLTVAFTNTSNGNGRTITALTWNFGDSTTYSGQNPPAHIYSSKGTYAVKLTATTSCGSNTKTAYVTVSTKPVVVPGTYGPVCVNGSKITLGGSPVGGTWFGDGVSGNTFNSAVAGPGNHVLTYQYTSGSGCSFSNTTTLTVVPLPQTTITVG